MARKLSEISGNIVDVLNNRIYSGTIKIEDGKIKEIIEISEKFENYIIPGFVDSHIHIESSMLTPSEFARIALKHGTVATVSDPHEIANVLGIEGVKYMIEDGKKSPLKFYFCAPSCVPATIFETSGASLGAEELSALLEVDNVPSLGEIMNFPGVINNDQAVLAKIDLAKKFGKLVDGHSPGLSGEDLKKYIEAGITTDHECSTKEEALGKIGLGMKVQIREGSAAKNFEALFPITKEYYSNCMFCSDDKHPDDLLKGRINLLVKRSVEKGLDIMKTLQIASVNPVKHYGLKVGLLQVGDLADFLEVDNLTDLNISKTVINGECVYENGNVNFEKTPTEIVNNFKAEPISLEDVQVSEVCEKLNVIEAIDGQLFTKWITTNPKVEKGFVISDLENDILKIVVVNRYFPAKPVVGFIKGFVLKRGAIASSVAHDSHNVIAVGADDENIVGAINSVIENKGGISVVSIEDGIREILPLPIAGLVSDLTYEKIADKYYSITAKSKDLGSRLNSPFMTLSFMSLLVIPEIKISDKGLFDGNNFMFI